MATITLNSGRKFDPINPSPASITIEDLAYALSHTSRWCGHTIMPGYSVGQHSIHVSERCEHYPLHGLLHDAHEVLGVRDWPRPVKAEMPLHVLNWFESLAAKIDIAVFTAFRCDLFAFADSYKEVKRVDDLMLKTEGYQLMPKTNSDEGWKQIPGEPYDFKIPQLTPREVEQLFLQRFAVLKA